MAGTAGAIAGAVMENASADKIVFSDKKTEFLESDKLDSSSSNKGGSSGDTPITPKDFYWDQILFYLVSAILGLSFLDISVEFFRGSIIQCYITDVAASRDQVAYLNNYCYNSLPNSQYYLIFILISALIIIAPHYLWTSYFGAYFDFFFDLAKKLHRLRDTKTGEYNPYNFELVKKLEQKFSSTNPWMFRWYKLKLLGQLGVCLIVETVNAFYFEADDFNESFLCPTNTGLLNTTVWPLPEQLNCVYNSLTLLYFLRNTALGLVAAAIVVIMMGLVWCFVRHTNELGAKDIAAFCDVSCLPPEEYPFPSTRKVFRRIFHCGKEERLLEKNQPKSSENGQGQRELDDIQVEQPNLDENEEEDDKPLCCPCFSGFWNGLKQMFIPRIHTDLDFLVARLFYADSGHGQVFKDIQIHKDLDERTSQDHELLYLLNSVHSHLLSKQIDALEAGLPIEDEEEEWERKGDFRDYFLDSNFGKVNVEEQVYSYFEQHMGVDKKIWSYSPLRSVLFSFLKFAPANDLAMDVSFGNRIGHSLILARVFYNSVTVHFNKFYRNQKEICREDNYQANFRTFTYQANIFSQTAQSITKSEKLIINLFNEKVGGRKLDLILIGPITDQSKRVTTNLLIEKIYEHEGYLSDRAILLAIRPLMIGPKSCTGRFIQYQPPKGIFDDIEEEVNEYLVKSNVPVYSVGPNGVVKKIEDLTKYQKSRRSSTRNLRRRRTIAQLMGKKEQKPPPYGLVIQCNDIQCIYEFRVFRKKDPKKGQGERREQRSMASSDDVPTDKLVSPLQSPTSLPNLTIPPSQNNNSNISIQTH